VERQTSIGYAGICYAPPLTKERRGCSFAWSAGMVNSTAFAPKLDRIQSAVANHVITYRNDQMSWERDTMQESGRRRSEVASPPRLRHLVLFVHPPVATGLNPWS